MQSFLTRYANIRREKLRYDWAKAKRMKVLRQEKAAAAKAAAAQPAS